ncbi:MAG TPA: hypothetical protein DD490_23120 [Acidobacteria bacterium]|nr:hypothetical protein [Acidobacteriota bacterium]
MKPLSSRTSRSSSGCLAVFFGVFLVAGCAGSYFLLWKPWSAWVAARSWAATPCTILESRVVESSDSDGSTYRVDVTYAYVFNGREYQGSRYDFMGGSSSGRESKDAVVAENPPGSRTTCWVDPDDPSQAVFDRGLSWIYLIGLFPLVFVAVGAGGMIYGFRSHRSSPAASASAPGKSPFGVDIPPQGSQPRQLSPQMSPVGKLVGIILAAVVWNGIVSVFLWQVVKGWRTGAGDGCLTAFVVPFVLVGLGLIFAIFQQFLVLFNPRLELTLGPGVLAPGESALLQWTMRGKAERVQKLRIVLEGREEATYRQGTRTTTAREVFSTVLLAEVDNSFSIANGTARVSLPDDAPPSFAASRNKIVWALKVTLEIPNWPDSADEYEIVVAPAALRQRFGG